MRNIVRNLSSSWRQLCRSPEVTILAVATLALGIGANTAMFTVVENVLLRPLPYKDPDRLVQVTTSGPETGAAASWLDYLDLRNQSHALAAVGGYSNDVGVIQSNGSTLSVVASEVTPNVFAMLGRSAARGRTFSEEEGRSGGPPAVIISEGLWRQVLGADNAVLGRPLRVNGKDRTIVGIMPAGFRFPESAGNGIEKGLWLPMQPTPEMLRERGFDFLTIIAKSASGATHSQVQNELTQFAKWIRERDPGADRKLSFHAESYNEAITGPVRSVFRTLVAALGLVLLIVCANVANLLIARGLDRQHEFAVRAALGCSRGRLMSLMVAEAAILSFLGAALGLLISYWIIAAVHRLPAGVIPRSESIEVHWTVLLILAAIAAFSTTLSALLPTLVIANAKAQDALRSGSRSVGMRGFRSRTSVWLVGAEVALSAVLLIAAGLLFRTLWGLDHARLGFDATGLTSFTATPADASGFGNSGGEGGRAAPPIATTVYLPLLERLRHTPGFQDVAMTTAPPFSGLELQTSFRVIGWPPELQQGLSTRITALSGRYQELMSTAVLCGRTLTEMDAANSPFVAVINETLARRYFRGKNPLGQRFDLGGRATGMTKPYTIVGVVRDQIDTSAAQPVHPLLMLPFQQIPPASLFYPALLKTAVHFVVKTRAGFPVGSAARAVFRRLAPDLALDNVQTLQELVDQSNSGSLLGLSVVSAFATLAIVMVIAGIYGVLTQVVSQRRREFGLRMALGATRQSIAQMILLRGSVIVMAGLAVGIVLAFFLRRLIQAFLFGVKPLDPGSYAFAVVALLLVCAMASLIPAWRAASVEPLKALRDE